MKRLAALLLLCASVTYGGVVDVPRPSGDPAKNRANIQAAVDRATSTGNWLGGPGVVRFGEGVWTIDGPIFLDRASGPFSKVSLRGLGRDVSRVEMQRFVGKDAFLWGFDRRPRLGAAREGIPLDPESLPPSPIVADRRAFRTLGRLHLAQYGGHLDQGPGDWYGTTRKLTVEYAITFHGAAAANGGGAPVISISDGVAAPLAIVQSNSRPTVTIATVGPDPSDPESVTSRDFQLDVDRPLNADTLYKVTIQVDLDAPEMLRAWIGDRPATVALRSGPPPKAGERFHPNRYAPWVVGGSAFAGGDPPVDFTLSGYKVTAASLYDPLVPGLARRDGQPVDDARYFKDEIPWFALLPLADPPANVAKDRLVTVRGRDSGGNVIESGAYIAEPEHARAEGMTLAGEIRDLGIAKGDSWYGTGVALGMVSGARVRDSDVGGGAYGVGTFGGFCYPLDLDRLTLVGHSAPISLAWTSSATANDLYFPEPYRCAVQVVYGGIRIRKVNSPHFGRPEFGFVARYGALQLEQIALDNEDPDGGSLFADVYCLPGIAGQPSSAYLTIDDMDGVYSRPGSSKVLLGGPPLLSPLRQMVGACVVRIDGLAIHDLKCRAVVRALPAAEGLWQDGGIRLMGRTSIPDFEGPSLGPPRPVDTAPTRSRPADTK